MDYDLKSIIKEKIKEKISKLSPPEQDNIIEKISSIVIFKSATRVADLKKEDILDEIVNILDDEVLNISKNLLNR